MHEQERREFNTSADDVAANISTMLRRDADLVTVMRTIVQLDPKATHRSVGRWLDTMGAERRYPGVDRLEYVERIPAARLRDFFRRVRAEQPELRGRLTVTPPGHRSHYCLSRISVVLTGLRLVRGQFQDFCRDGVFGEAPVGLKKATESAKLTVTPGFGELIYMYEPVYRDGRSPASIAGRRRAVTGWSLGMFHSDQLLSEAVGKRPLTVELYRVDAGQPPQLISAGGNAPDGKRIARTVPIAADGTWRIRILGSPVRRGLSADAQGALVMFAGVALFTMLFALIRTLDRSRARAMQLVGQRTRQLRHSEARLISMAASSPTGILQVNDAGEFEYGNERLRELLGLSNSQLRGHGWMQAFSVDDRKLICHMLGNPAAARTDGVEMRIPGANVRWVRFAIAPLQEADLDTGHVHTTGFVASVEDVTLAHDARERLLYEAGHDALTGLPNRMLFLERLEERIAALRDGSGEFAVLYVDLDRFKPINDVLGHVAGDDVLKAVGRRLTSALRAGDLLARHSGDEFTVLISEYDDRAVVERIVRRIQASVSEPIDVEGEQVTVGASVGVVYVDDAARDAAEILQDADIAMYRAKHGRRGFQIFEPSLRHHNQSMLQIEQGLRTALANDEFELAYQPFVDLRSGEIVGAEALLRWRHPQRGLLYPGAFLPQAETSGLIVAIGSWVTEAAIEFLSQQPKGFTMAVNASVQQLLAEGFVEHLESVARSHRINRSHLCIELVESDALDDEALLMVERLRGLGYQVGIDDFGTGYNSLIQIKRFAMDFVKIDRGFATDLASGSTSAVVLENIVSLSHALGLRVVAEGIERDDQAAIAKSAGCDWGQGFLWSPGLPAAEFLEFRARFEDEADTDGPLLRAV